MPRPPSGKPNRPARPRTPPAPPTARCADRYRLYQLAVQEPDAELDFLDRVYKHRRGVRPRTLREDFCAAYAICCAWVARRQDNVALGVDLDPEPLAWGREHNAAPLSDDQRSRLHILRGDVLADSLVARSKALRVDAIMGLNFSYWIFKDRATLGRYFRNARAALRPGGLFILDIFGGSEVHTELVERRRCKGFTYVWDQHRYDPISGNYTCKIHFEFRDGTALRDAFTYPWRLWTIPEVRDLLHEAGFRSVDVYWEGDDGHGGGNGVYTRRSSAESERSYVAYIVAE